MKTPNNKTPKILAVGATAGFFAVLVLMFFVGMPETARDGINMMLGFLGGMLTSAFSFYFGSSDKG